MDGGWKEEGKKYRWKDGKMDGRKEEKDRQIARWTDR